MEHAIIESNYIKQIFEKLKNNPLKCLEKIDEFFEKNNFDQTIESIIELINNNQYFKKILEIIFEKYETIIKIGQFENIINNNFIIQSIETYCMLNDIEIKEPEETTEETNYEKDIDSFKAYINSIKKYKLLTKEEEQELFIKYNNGDKRARKKLIESNLRLVIAIAKRYQGRGIQIQDLVQEGNLGIIKAVERFDVNRGYKFSSYATYWIKQSIQRAIEEKARNIKIPAYLYNKINKYLNDISELQIKLGRVPTKEEIEKYTEYTKEEIEIIEQNKLDARSINETISDDKETELENFIILDEKSPEKIAEERNLTEKIQELLKKSNLSEREIEILTARYGLGTDKKETQETISQKYNITRERIRQIEAAALQKLRKSKDIIDFLEYTENPVQAEKNLKIYRTLAPTKIKTKSLNLIKEQVGKQRVAEILEEKLEEQELTEEEIIKQKMYKIKAQMHAEAKEQEEKEPDIRDLVSLGTLKQTTIEEQEKPIEEFEIPKQKIDEIKEKIQIKTNQQNESIKENIKSPKISEQKEEKQEQIKNKSIEKNIKIKPKLNQINTKKQEQKTKNKYKTKEQETKINQVKLNTSKSVEKKQSEKNEQLLIELDLKEKQNFIITPLLEQIIKNLNAKEEIGRAHV